MFRLFVFGPDGNVCSFSRPAGLVDLSIAARYWTLRGHRTEIVVNTRARQRECEQAILASKGGVAFWPATAKVIFPKPKPPPDADCHGK